MMERIIKNRNGERFRELRICDIIVEVICLANLMSSRESQARLHTSKR
jgi:hypothetical protein